jgi:hypothetical protein
MKIPSAIVTPLVAVTLLCALSTGGQPTTPKQNTSPATDQPPYDACRYVGRGFGSSGNLIDIDNLIAEEKKLPDRLTYPIEAERLADGLLALITFTDKGIGADGFAINTLGQELHNECQARVSDESTIIALQNQLKELQRQVSILQKELRPKPVPKGDRP